MNKQHNLTNAQIRRKEKQKEKKRTKRSFENTMKRIAHLPVNLQQKIVVQSYIERERNVTNEEYRYKDLEEYLNNKEARLRRELSERHVKIVMDTVRKELVNKVKNAVRLRKKIVKHIKKTYMEYHFPSKSWEMEEMGYGRMVYGDYHKTEFEDWGIPLWINKKEWGNNGNPRVAYKIPLKMPNSERKGYLEWLLEWQDDWENYTKLEPHIKKWLWREGYKYGYTYNNSNDNN